MTVRCAASRRAFLRPGPGYSTSRLCLTLARPRVSCSPPTHRASSRPERSRGWRRPARLDLHGACRSSAVAASRSRPTSRESPCAIVFVANRATPAVSERLRPAKRSRPPDPHCRASRRRRTRRDTLDSVPIAPVIFFLLGTAGCRRSRRSRLGATPPETPAANARSRSTQSTARLVVRAPRSTTSRRSSVNSPAGAFDDARSSSRGRSRPRRVARGAASGCRLERRADDEVGHEDKCRALLGSASSAALR